MCDGITQVSTRRRATPAARSAQSVGHHLHVPDPDGFGRRKACRTPAQLVGLLHQRAGVRKQRRAVRGEGDRSAVAVEQADLEIAFEGLDLLRERRARDVQPLGRAAEVQLLGDGEEVAQLTQLHAASVEQ